MCWEFKKNDFEKKSANDKKKLEKFPRGQELNGPLYHSFEILGTMVHQSVVFSLIYGMGPVFEHFTCSLNTKNYFHLLIGPL